MSNLTDKQAAKKLLKLAKAHPDWYSKKDVFYAKQVKKRIKKEEQSTDK
jgi:hypothetical protein|tara:strand:+ start:477 stop:623 length:147 start_codon:yes stop_codon:yes gene_type:complete